MQFKEIYAVHFDTGRSWRGGQNQVYSLISGLRSFGIKQLLITPEGSPLEKHVKDLNIDIENIDPVNDLDIAGGIRFRKIIKRENPGIVHFHTSKSLGVGCWALRGLNIKTVFTRRVDFPVSKNPLNLLKYRYPDSIVAISDFIKHQLMNLGFENITRIYSAVDLNRFRFKENMKENNRINVGMIGAFDLKHKDFITFVRSASLVIQKKNRQKEIKFLTAGTGRDEAKIRKTIKSLKVEDDVKIKGFVPDIEEFISSLDILVHTVNFEGLGTSILQAMAAGIPVIATDVGGIPELIEDGENGYLVEKNNPADVSEKILRLVEDVELRKRFRIKGREIVKDKFSKERMVKDYIKLYDQI